VVVIVSCLIGLLLAAILVSARLQTWLKVKIGITLLFSVCARIKLGFVTSTSRLFQGFSTLHFVQRDISAV
jgi:hypothetical protein